MTFAHAVFVRSLQAALLLTAAPLALAQATSDDAPAMRDPFERAMAWGPCPAFMPKGCGLAIVHGQGDKPNADVFLKIPGKGSIPNHTHTSAERMVLVAGQMIVTYEAQKPMTVKAGSYMYGPAKMPHTATCVSAKPCILFIAFEAPVDAIPVTPPGKP